MDYVIDAVHGFSQTNPIPHVTDEIAHHGLVEDLPHLELLELIAGVNDGFRGAAAFQQRLYQL